MFPSHDRAGPNDNVGIVMGLSRTVGIDIDNKNGKNGIESFDKLCRKHNISKKELDTFSTFTPNEGFHHIYSVPNGHLYKSNQDKLGDGIDVIGDGYFLMAPDQEIKEKKVYKNGKWVT